MFIKAELANIGGFELASFDVIYICRHCSALGTLIFRRCHASPRRALFIELPLHPAGSSVERIREALDPRQLQDGWLP
jgi:hypothetical protein